MRIPRNRPVSIAALCIALLCQSAAAIGEERFGFFRDFLQAVRERRTAAIAEYVTDPHLFFVGKQRLSPGVEDFVYGDEHSFIEMKGFKSLITFIEMGPYTVKTSEQESGAVIFYVIPDIYIQDANEIEFYEDEWMKKYFACEFSRVDGRWKMQRSFCFAETGGPHERPHG